MCPFVASHEYFPIDFALDTDLLSKRETNKKGGRSFLLALLKNMKFKATPYLFDKQNIVASSNTN